MYTNVKQYGNNILFRGIHNGVPIQKKIKYKPSLFVPTNEDSKYKTLYGESLKKLNFNDINSAKEFLRKHEKIENFKIYGNTKFEYCLISDLYKEVKWDLNNIRIAIFDIEVNSNPETGGFASTDNPFQPIISIALKFINEDKFYLFGYDDFDAPEDTIYIKCKDEWTLLKKFIQIWSIKYPDIVSGWLTDNFDIIYLINRCNKIIGESETKKLSPWGIIQDKKTKRFNPKFKRYEEDISYSILGIASLDYIDLYKKYQPGGNSKESYRLDFIAETEIGENKTEYEGSLHNLYVTDKQKFYEYNLQDVRLVENLDKHCKLFELALTLAYYTKTNYEDIYHQTRLGDALCFNSLREQNIQIPCINKNEFVDYKGAYVKPPITGLYKWIATIDAASLYPSAMRTWNISPETLIEPIDYTENMQTILKNDVSVESILAESIDLSSLKEDNVCLTPNGQFFRTDKKGFIPTIVAKLFDERKLYKKKMLSYQSQYEKELDVTKKEELNKLVVKYNAFQVALKLVANSLYGSIGNQYFRWYDVRLAEAITLSGQLTNRWIIKYINEYLNVLLNLDKDYVLAADTDSLIITLQDIIEKFIPKDIPNEKIIKLVNKIVDKKIQPEVDNVCNKLLTYCNVADHSISYKLEKICSSGVFVAKKRYALNVYSNEGVVYAEPKIKVTGLEIVKSSTPAKVKTALKTCVSIILNKTQDELQEFVRNFKKEFLTFQPEEIAFPRGVNGLNKYFDDTTLYSKGTPVHVRASLLFNKLLQDKSLDTVYESIKEGDKIKYCYLKVPNPLKENVISFSNKLPKEFALHPFIDYNTMLEKSFLEPLQAITTKIGWELEKRNTIDSFF